MSVNVGSAASESFLSGGGRMGERFRSHDWSDTPLGHPSKWSGSLAALISVMLSSRQPMFIAWGPQRILLYNDGYVPMLGERQNQALGRPFFDVWPEVREEVGALMDRVDQDDPVHMDDLQLTVRRNGVDEEAHFAFSYTPVRGPSGGIDGLFCACAEITNQVMAERRAQRIRERSRTWEVTSDLIGIANPSGYFFKSNPAWKRTLGWTEQEISQTHLFDFIHPEDLASTREALQQLRSGEPVLSFENRYRAKDGNYRWLSWVAVPEDGVYYCTARDVTDAKVQALALESAMRERNGLWELSRDIMLRCGFDGIITAVNPAWYETLGWKEDELLGSTLFDLIHPDDLDHTLEGAKALSEGKSHTRFDNRYRHRNGNYRWISWATRAGDGLINAVGRDFTVEHDRDEHLKATEEALRQAQKMEAVGQLTGGLAHDFNNLLAGISGSLEMMGTRIAQGRVAEVERYLVAAQSASKRAAALTHRLLAFSRRQTLEPKPTDVNRLISSMEDLLRRTVGPQISVEAVEKAGLWPVLVDANQLENSLLNLCINARDAMPNGGKITIETANRWIDERVSEERDLAPGQYVSMCVSDNGTGMSRDVIERAFDPFFTTKPIGVGTGLGLSMIYGFARQSGGQVKIYSELDQGSMVCIYLPRHHLDEIEEVKFQAEPVVGTNAAETVLVIDDEPLVRMLIVEALEELGYRPIEAGDGPSAMKIIQGDTRIDLLITDVGLPNGMNGRQVADAARQLRPDLKVMFVTGYAENAVLSHGHLDPGMQVVTKPFDIASLSRRVQKIIAEPFSGQSHH